MRPTLGCSVEPQEEGPIEHLSIKCLRRSAEFAKLGSPAGPSEQPWRRSVSRAPTGRPWCTDGDAATCCLREVPSGVGAMIVRLGMVPVARIWQKRRARARRICARAQSLNLAGEVEESLRAVETSTWAQRQVSPKYLPTLGMQASRSRTGEMRFSCGIEAWAAWSELGQPGSSAKLTGLRWQDRNRS